MLRFVAFAAGLPCELPFLVGIVIPKPLCGFGILCFCCLITGCVFCGGGFYLDKVWFDFSLSGFEVRFGLLNLVVSDLRWFGWVWAALVTCCVLA